MFNLSSRHSRQREISAVKLIRDILYLDGTRYLNKKIRKQELNKLVNQLTGKKISSGATLNLFIRESVDKSGWVLVAKAVYPAIKPSRRKAPMLKAVNEHDITELLIEDIRRDTGIQGEDEPLNMMAF